MNDVFEQAQRFTEMWTNLATKVAAASAGGNGDAASPEASKQIRGAIFAALSQQAEQFMRSEQFLDLLRQSMSGSIQMREQMKDYLTEVHHGLQGVARQDVDSLLIALRHLETRVLDRLEAVDGKIDALARQLKTLKTANGGTGGTRQRAGKGKRH